MKSKGKLYSKHSSSFPPWHCHTVSTQADDDPLYNSSHRQAHHHSSRWRHAKNLSSSSRNSRHLVKFTVEAPGLCKYSHDSSVSEILSCMSLNSANSFTKPFMNLLIKIVKDIPPEISYLHEDLIVDALSREELSLYRIRKGGAKVMLTSSDSVLKFISKRQKQNRRTHIYVGILQRGSSSVNLPEQPSDSMKTSSRVSESSFSSRRIRSPVRNDVDSSKGRQVKFSGSMKTSSRVSESSLSRRIRSPVRHDVHVPKGRQVKFSGSMKTSSRVSESSSSRRSDSPVRPSTSMKTSSRVSGSSSSRRSGSPVRSDVHGSKGRGVTFRNSMNSSSSVSESSLSRRFHSHSFRRIHSRNDMQESNKLCHVSSSCKSDNLFWTKCDSSSLHQPATKDLSKSQTRLSVGENRPSIVSCSAGLSSRAYHQESSSKPQVPDDKRGLLARRSVPRSGVDEPSVHVQHDKNENDILSETSRKRIRIYSTVGKSDESKKHIGPNSTDGKSDESSLPSSCCHDINDCTCVPYELSSSVLVPPEPMQSPSMISKVSGDGPSCANSSLVKSDIMKIHDQSIEETADNPSDCDHATGLANCSHSRTIDSHYMNGKGYKSNLHTSSLDSDPLLDSTKVSSQDSHQIYSSKPQGSNILLDRVLDRVDLDPAMSKENVITDPVKDLSSMKELRLSSSSPTASRCQQDQATQLSVPIQATTTIVPFTEAISGCHIQAPILTLGKGNPDVGPPSRSASNLKGEDQRSTGIEKSFCDNERYSTTYGSPPEVIMEFGKEISSLLDSVLVWSDITKTPSRLPRPPEELHKLSVCDKAVDEDSSSDHCRNAANMNYFPLSDRVAGLATAYLSQYMLDLFDCSMMCNSASVQQQFVGQESPQVFESNAPYGNSSSMNNNNVDLLSSSCCHIELDTETSPLLDGVPDAVEASLENDKRNMSLTEECSTPRLTLFSDGHTVAREFLHSDLLLYHQSSSGIFITNTGRNDTAIKTVSIWKPLHESYFMTIAANKSRSLHHYNPSTQKFLSSKGTTTDNDSSPSVVTHNAQPQMKLFIKAGCRIAFAASA